MHGIYSIYMVFSMLFVITGTWNRVNWRLLVKIEKLRNFFWGGGDLEFLGNFCQDKNLCGCACWRW